MNIIAQKKHMSFPGKNHLLSLGCRAPGILRNDVLENLPNKITFFIFFSLLVELCQF